MAGRSIFLFVNFTQVYHIINFIPVSRINNSGAGGSSGRCAKCVWLLAKACVVVVVHRYLTLV